MAKYLAGETPQMYVYSGTIVGCRPKASSGCRTNVETVLNDVGFIKHSVTIYPQPEDLSFSDRPQFVARDSTGRILFSTKVVPELQQVGTIRKASVPDPVSGR